MYLGSFRNRKQLITHIYHWASQKATRLVIFTTYKSPILRFRWMCFPHFDAYAPNKNLMLVLRLVSERHGSLTPHDFSMQTHIEPESLPLHAATELGPCQQIFRIGPLLGFKEDTAWVWSPWSKTLLSMAWMASLGPKLFKRPVLQGILIGTSREVLTFRPWQAGSANGPTGDIYIYSIC